MTNFLRNKKKEIALSLFSIVLTLMLLEVTLRLFFPQITEHKQLFEFDARLGWKFAPNKNINITYSGVEDHYVKTNSMGFRDNPIRLSDEGKSKRILTLGDSFVSNIAVKSDEVFTEVIENQLAETEVLNFGINGYSQVQEYLLLKEWHKVIKPDIIVLMVYLRNDFQENVTRDWHYPRPYASWNREDSTFKNKSHTSAKAFRKQNFQYTSENIFSIAFVHSNKKKIKSP